MATGDKLQTVRDPTPLNSSWSRNVRCRTCLGTLGCQPLIVAAGIPARPLDPTPITGEPGPRAGFLVASV